MLLKSSYFLCSVKIASYYAFVHSQFSLLYPEINNDGSQSMLPFESHAQSLCHESMISGILGALRVRADNLKLPYISLIRILVTF
jgi:hypothetical protein